MWWCSTKNYVPAFIIYDYIKKNIQWNEIDGIWALDGVRSAWKEKKGTSKSELFSTSFQKSTKTKCIYRSK